MRWRLGRGAVSVSTIISTVLLGSPAIVGAQVAGDADAARRVVEQARGTSEFMCELALRSLGNRFGGWYWASAPDAAADQSDLLEWASNRIEGQTAIPTLSDAMSDRDPCVRRVAARLLGHIEHPRASEALLDLLGSRNAETRQMAAIGLGYQDKRSAVNGLVDALRDPAAPVRAAAAWALGKIEDASAIEALTHVLLEDEDALVRRQAARALGEMP